VEIYDWCNGPYADSHQLLNVFHAFAIILYDTDLLTSHCNFHMSADVVVCFVL